MPFFKSPQSTPRTIYYAIANGLALVGVFLVLFYEPAPAKSQLEWLDVDVEKVEVLRPPSGDHHGKMFAINESDRQLYLPTLPMQDSNNTLETVRELEGKSVRMGLSGENNRIWYLKVNGLPFAHRGSRLPSEPFPWKGLGVAMLLAGVGMVLASSLLSRKYEHKRE